RYCSNGAVRARGFPFAFVIVGSWGVSGWSAGRDTVSVMEGWTEARASRLGRLIAMLGLIALAGCQPPEAQFSFNQLYLERQEQETGSEFAPQQVMAVVNAVTALFGTPDAPHMEPVEGIDEVLNLKNLIIAAGPIKSDNYGKGEGLYRQHCVHCYGITGIGRRPTAAFLSPYPRDFALGTFKFNSTVVGIQPMTDDLRLIIEEGIDGTAMPSFNLLPEGEVEALIDYVKYL